jgi:hypothetical protein
MPEESVFRLVVGNGQLEASLMSLELYMEASKHCNKPVCRLHADCTGSGVIASDLMIILYSKPGKLTYLACVTNSWMTFI